MLSPRQLVNSVAHLFFPHHCAACGSDVIHPQASICGRCLHDLPYTGFENKRDNPVERMFYGRIPFRFASSLCYFTKQSIVQQLLHEFKYRNNRDAGVHAGKLMGTALMQSHWSTFSTAIVPLPLYYSREKRRGYNQANLLAEGISSVMKIPVIGNLVKRVEATATQTKMSRSSRWENISGRFALNDSVALNATTLLLVDDVITTGATIEACARALCSLPGVELAVASFAYTLK